MNNEKLDTKKILISGFALFAIFFGAGNLIFPPFLGMHSGDGWFVSSMGFNLSDSLLILLGILAVSKRSANLNEFGVKISKNFGSILSLICITLVGPLLSIPRTGATTFQHERSHGICCQRQTGNQIQPLPRRRRGLHPDTQLVHTGG